MLFSPVAKIIRMEVRVSFMGSFIAWGGWEP